MKESREKKSVGLNAVLNIIKQMMSILFPMVTVYFASRKLGQTNFGEVNYIRSIISYFSLFASLGISTYAIREGAYYRGNRKKYIDFSNQVFTINIYSTIIAYIVLVLFIVIPLSPFHEEGALMFIFGMSIIFQTVGADWVNATFEDYFYITVRYLLFNGIALILLFLFIKEPKDYLLYAAILVFASYGGNILNVFYIKRYVNLKIVSIQKCTKHLKPILLLFSVELATNIYINSDITMLGVAVNKKAVAIYTVSSNIYVAVKRLANAAVTVTLPRLSFYVGSGKKEEYKILLGKIINYVLVLLLPCLVGTFELSENLMIIMGGVSYSIGSLSLKILSIALVFAVMAYILSRCILLPYKQDKLYMIATLGSAVVNIILNILLIPQFSYDGAALTTLISECLVCLVMCVKSRKIININIDKRAFIITIVGCIPIIIICEIIKRIASHNLLVVLTAFMMSFVVYSLILVVFRHPMYNDIKRYWKL